MSNHRTNLHSKDHVFDEVEHGILIFTSEIEFIRLAWLPFDLYREEKSDFTANSSRMNTGYRSVLPHILMPTIMIVTSNTVFEHLGHSKYRIYWWSIYGPSKLLQSVDYHVIIDFVVECTMFLNNHKIQMNKDEMIPYWIGDYLVFDAHYNVHQVQAELAMHSTFNGMMRKPKSKILKMNEILFNI